VDPFALQLVRGTWRVRFRVVLAKASYAGLPHQLASMGWELIDGFLLDLGVSSMQFDTAERGFSFRVDGPIDMRFDPSTPRSAAELVNEIQEGQLASVISSYGEEPRARQIAKAIVRARPLKTTRQLAEVVEEAAGGRRDRIHPATRTFQALRIAVNHELDSLRRVLPLATKALRPGGRLAVISFHSLEDRIVKEFFREQASEKHNPPFEPIHETERGPILGIVTKKPITAAASEVRENPRARSAKLRVAEAAMKAVDQLARLPGHAVASSTPVARKRPGNGPGADTRCGTLPDVTSQTAIAGREQDPAVRSAMADTIATSETRLAVATSASLMERALDLGFVPMQTGEADYVLVPGYIAPEPAVLSSSRPPEFRPPKVDPAYTQSLLDWLSEAAAVWMKSGQVQ
jgi:16S rRNA (cytosine1402-N4)-methyltransferase